MSWEGPGFVDRHTQLLRVATGRAPDTSAAWHRRVESRWSTPVDEPSHPPLELHDGTRGEIERALHEARALGLVQVTEAGVDDWGYLQALVDLRARHGELPVRVRLLVEAGLATESPKRLARTGDPWVEVEGVRFVADGTVAARTAAVSSVYDDEPDAGLGVLFLDADLLARRLDPFAEQGWTIAVDAAGDRAITTVLDAYEKVYGSDCAAAAPRIEHPVVLTDELVRRIASLGVVVSVDVGAGVAGLLDARAALGSRADDAHRLDLLLEAGVPLLVGSAQPLVGLRRLTTGDPEDGSRVGAPTLPLDVALDLMGDAACGTVVLSEDPHGVAEDELTSVEVEDTRPAG